MKKNVIISISGSQMALGDEAPVELVVKGRYNKIGDTAYIKYKEIDDEGAETDCLIKIGKDTIEIVKKGAIGSNLLFERGKSNLSPYQTPFGVLMVSITTKEMIVLEDEDALVAKVKYGLDINYDFVADCDVNIKIASILPQ